MKVKPFKAIRPAEGFESKVSSLPYDVYSEKEARDIVDANPMSFLSIVRSETNFPVGTDPYGSEVYEKAKDLIAENIKKGIFVKEDSDCYYIYRQIMNGRSQTGLVACYSVDEYLENKIKRHEFTRKDKEIDRTTHIDVCSAHTGLIFLAFRENGEAEVVIKEALAEKPLYDFTAIDGVQQTIWKVSAPEKVAKITKAFENLDALYIADGHHRCASSGTVCKMRREANPGYTGEEEFNYFLAVAFPAQELCIYPYYRVLSDLGGMSKDELLEKLAPMFEIEQKEIEGIEPANQGEIALYIEETWYKLTAKDEIKKTDAVGCLDASLLQDNVLKPIFGIEDPRTDKRIDFIGGIRGVAEVEKRCHEDMKAAFILHHTSMEQLMRVADEGQVMPPKSTWFEPKLQSGLLVHEF